MGSFAEYLYEDIFKNEYVGPSTTKDIDLMYNNIRKPDKNICLINKLKEKGFVYLEDPVTGTSKFYKDGDVELEFLTKRLGKGENLQQNIIPLGIKADSMRDINILDLPYVIEKNNYIINVPEPAVFVIQKILINEHRVPEFKRSKDIDSVKKLLPCILHSKEHKQKFIEIYNNLSKKTKNNFS